MIQSLPVKSSCSGRCPARYSTAYHGQRSTPFSETKSPPCLRASPLLARRSNNFERSASALDSHDSSLMGLLQEPKRVLTTKALRSLRRSEVRRLTAIFLLATQGGSRSPLEERRRLLLRLLPRPQLVGKMSWNKLLRPSQFKGRRTNETLPHICAFFSFSPLHHRSDQLTRPKSLFVQTFQFGRILPLGGSLRLILVHGTLRGTQFILRYTDSMIRGNPAYFNPCVSLSAESGSRQIFRIRP